MNGVTREFQDLPRAWSPPTIERRLADIKSSSYDAKGHTVEATLSAGSEVKRFYGTEVLLITPAAVDLKRVTDGICPVIDSHQIAGIKNVLGRLQEAHFESGKLVGTLSFDDSEAGRHAEGLIARGTIRGVSIGYSVSEWRVSDADGNVVDPERERLQWDAEYVFTATRWELLETSLVSVPADPQAQIRSRAFGSTAIGAEIAAEILCRMRCRSRMARRHFG